MYRNDLNRDEICVNIFLKQLFALSSCTASESIVVDIIIHDDVLALAFLISVISTGFFGSLDSDPNLLMALNLCFYMQL